MPSDRVRPAGAHALSDQQALAAGHQLIAGTAQLDGPHPQLIGCLHKRGTWVVKLGPSIRPRPDNCGQFRLHNTKLSGKLRQLGSTRIRRLDNASLLTGQELLIHLPRRPHLGELPLHRPLVGVVGAEPPLLAPPYLQPRDPRRIDRLLRLFDAGFKQAATFRELVPPACAVACNVQVFLNHLKGDHTPLDGVKRGFGS